MEKTFKRIFANFRGLWKYLTHNKPNTTKMFQNNLFKSFFFKKDVLKNLTELFQLNCSFPTCKNTLGFLGARDPLPFPTPADKAHPAVEMGTELSFISVIWPTNYIRNNFTKTQIPVLIIVFFVLKLKKVKPAIPPQSTSVFNLSSIT